MQRYRYLRSSFVLGALTIASAARADETVTYVYDSLGRLHGPMLFPFTVRWRPALQSELFPRFVQEPDAAMRSSSWIHLSGSRSFAIWSDTTRSATRLEREQLTWPGSREDVHRWTLTDGGDGSPASSASGAGRGSEW